MVKITLENKPRCSIYLSTPSRPNMRPGSRLDFVKVDYGSAVDFEDEGGIGSGLRR